MRFLDASHCATRVLTALGLAVAGGVPAVACSSSGSTQPTSGEIYADGGTDGDAGDAGHGDAGAAGETLEAQVARGKQLYAQHCAECHGANGEGARAPRLVGLDQGALPLNPGPDSKMRKNQFRTASDVADFVVHSMPPTAPGSLPQDDYYAILAFDLQANGLDLKGHPLDGTTAENIEIHSVTEPVYRLRYAE
jgi:cytochrome c